MNQTTAETLRRLNGEYEQCRTIAQDKSDPCAEIYAERAQYLSDVIAIIGDAYETLDRCRRDMPRCEMLRQLEEKLA